MRFVSPLLKRVIYPSMARAGVFRHASTHGLAVVTYHGVLPEAYQVIDPALDGSLVTAASLREQLRLLKANYNVISPEQMRQWCERNYELPPGAVLVTCDDGLVNAVTDMLPILQEENVRCLFFVVGLSAADAPGMLWYEELYLMLAAAAEGPFSVPLSEVEVVGYLGSQGQRRALWWELSQFLVKCDYERCRHFLDAVRAKLALNGEFASRYLTNQNARKRFSLLSRLDLQTLLSAGMSVGAHTLSHPMLSQLPDDRAWYEMTESRRRLQEAVGCPVWALAYPFGGPGSVSRRELSMAQKAGYTGAFLSYGGGFGADLPRYALPRIHITCDMTLSEFEAHVSGFYRSLRKRLGREDPSVAAMLG